MVLLVNLDVVLFFGGWYLGHTSNESCRIDQPLNSATFCVPISGKIYIRVFEVAPSMV